jgi:exodeoxyribonuclease VII small subunit
VKNDPKKLPKLEESMAEISQLIDQMEHGEQSLEQSLAQFERGITLIKHCHKILETAEQKVQILVQTQDQEKLTTFPDLDQTENQDDTEI